MTIPQKYEDLVLKVAELERREAALREELARYKSLFGQAQKAIDRLNELHPKRMGELVKRMTVAEQRAGDLESELRDALEWIESGDRIPYNMVRSIKAALKPAAEEYTSTLQHAGNLSSFAKEVIYGALEGGSFDGADIQEIAVNHGLLKIETRTEECGEVCACREYGFPSECYRKSDLLELKPAAEGYEEPLKHVDGDRLPAIGRKVFIHLGSSDSLVEHTVTGYYVWDDLQGNAYLHRVFVRVRDSAGNHNARLLKDVRLSAEGVGS